MGSAAAATRGVASLTHGSAAALLVLAGAAGCAAAPPGAAWPLRDFRSFTLRAPADWVASEGAIDSQAGRLQDPLVTLEYDLGLHADPLRAPFGAIELQAEPATVDGHSARRVRFVLPAGVAGPRQTCVGLHVPRLREQPRGPIRFTALACTTDPAKVELIAEVLSTLRFPRAAAP